MRHLALILLGTCALAAGPGLMPVPASYAPAEGRLLIDNSFRVALTGHREPRLERAAARLLHRLTRQTGVPFATGTAPDAASATLVVDVKGPSETVQKLGEDERYTLAVNGRSARVSAANPLGAMRGMETFLQMVEQDAKGWGIAAATIEDRPRFPWRGLSFDVARHFMPLEVVRRNIDGMAAVKMNVLHLHLVDDQGWRIESKRFPKLHQLGSDGLYYTQDEIRQLVEYARDRGIRVVPEFDIPGHSSALLTAYPEYGTMPGPYQIERKWGVFDPTLDPTKEALYPFLDGLIGEMAALFPDEFFHIGGDEVSGKHWRTAPHVQAFLKEKGLKDNHELQAYFNSRLQPIVAKHGKRMSGWDEILAPGLPKSIVIQSWRGPKSLVAAAQQGYAGLLSNGYYLDLMEPASRHYLMDPLPPESIAALTPEQQALVLGGEAAMWVEYVSFETVDSRIWPRAAAVAERLWSPASVRDLDSMYARLERTSRWLEATGLTHRSAQRVLVERIAGGLPTEPIYTLLEVVEPVKQYQRGTTGEYTQWTPLNRLVDAARPESDIAREFNAAVKRGELDGLRTQLVRWRENDARFAPIAAQRALLEGTAPLSADLSRIAAIGLEALEAIEKKTPRDAAWASAQTATLKAAAKQKAALLLMIVPGIQGLVDRAAAAR